MNNFEISRDKELALQILEINRIPAIRLADIKNCQFPVIGRFHGHHGGEDIEMVHNIDVAREGGYDYFTILNTFEMEMRITISELSIIKVEKAVPKQVVFKEIPIRTENYGWTWEEATLLNGWEELALRAAYVTGVRSGIIKIGKTSSRKLLVIDINALELDGHDKLALQSNEEPFTLGADLEFMLFCEEKLIPSSRFFEADSDLGCDERQIERNTSHYALAEIRPHYDESPFNLYKNIEKLLKDAAVKVPYKNIEFRAGNMPFSGYQCGGHIHFGLPASYSLIKALDHYLTVPIALLEDSRKGKRRKRTKHGGLGRYRLKEYGFEYLGLGSWIIEPKLSLAILCLAKVIATHHQELNQSFLFNPIYQRAFYSGNKAYLNDIFNDIKQDLILTSSYHLFSEQLDYLFSRIENGQSWDEESDMRKNWNLEVGDKEYDPGFTIQVSRDIRDKIAIRLDDKPVNIRAGKSFAKAVVEPYPFTFRYPETVQLSTPLSDKLNLPSDWTPRIIYENGVIQLGPIIGILASKPFGRQDSYFQHIHTRGKEKGMMVYVFSPDDINWDTLTVNGITYDGMAHKKGVFPLPDVIYDRHFIHSTRQEEVIEETRVRLQEVFGVKFLNPPSLFALTGDKWNCFEQLSNGYESGSFFPKTIRLEGFEDVTSMLDAYGDIYLKPIHGAMGKGILRICREEKGLICYDSALMTEYSITLEELKDIVSRLERDKNYIIQEGIKRKQLNGNLLEIRVYMQKNSRQKWVRTGMAARLTKRAIISRSREKVDRISKVLPRIYPDEAELKEVKKQLATVPHLIVKDIEQLTGACGELAIDLCIDQFDQLKIIEVNAKPDNLFSSIGAFRLRNLAAYRLLNYAASLAGFPPVINS